MARGGVVVPRGVRILWLMFLNGLFLWFSFDFIIKEVVLPSRVCFCVCVST